jgi:hypothetical protein
MASESSRTSEVDASSDQKICSGFRSLVGLRSSPSSFDSRIALPTHRWIAALMAVDIKSSTQSKAGNSLHRAVVDPPMELQGLSLRSREMSDKSQVKRNDFQVRARSAGALVVSHCPRKDGTSVALRSCMKCSLRSAWILALTAASTVACSVQSDDDAQGQSADELPVERALKQALKECVTRNGGLAKIGVPVSNGGGPVMPHPWGAGNITQDYKSPVTGALTMCIRKDGSEKAWMVRGSIRDTYILLGGPAKAGTPLEDEHGDAKLAQQQFEGGLIRWAEAKQGFEFVANAAPLRYAAPEGYWARPTNIEHYRVWESHEAAVAWFASYDAASAERVNRPALVALPHTDSRYLAVEATVAKLWPSFKSAFPRDTEGLSEPPRVLLVDAKGLQAYVSVDNQLTCRAGGPLGCQSHAVIIFTPMLSAIAAATTPDAPQDLLAGLLAHELAHHVLKHPFDSAKAKLTRYYAANAARPFGFQNTNDDAEVRRTSLSYIVEATKGGTSSQVELQGWPVAPSTHNQLAFKLFNSAFSANPDGCSNINATLLAANVPIQKNLSNIYQHIVFPNETERTNLTNAVAAFLTEAKRCTSMQTGFRELLKGQLAGNGKPIVDTLTPEEMTIVSSAATPFNAILALVENSRKKMRALEANVAKNRIFTEEEQADDVAVFIAQKSNINIHSHAMYMDKVQLKSAEQIECASIRATGTEPPYGALSDPHHANCWRVDHGERLAKLLEAQK